MMMRISKKFLFCLKQMTMKQLKKKVFLGFSRRHFLQLRKHLKILLIITIIRLLKAKQGEIRNQIIKGHPYLKMNLKNHQVSSELIDRVMLALIEQLEVKLFMLKKEIERIMTHSSQIFSTLGLIRKRIMGFFNNHLLYRLGRMQSNSSLQLILN